MTLTRITLQADDITDFAKARNAELAKAKSDWVFFVDADETVTPELELEVQEAIKNPDYDAYYLARTDTFLGRELRFGETGHARLIRLARRNFGQWRRPVHEVWEGQGSVGQLQHPLLHSPHASISSFLDKINLYSQIDAQYRYSQGSKSSLPKIILYPPAKFLYNYLWRFGLLDGVPGLIMAMMMSFHSYLTWTKLYLLWHKNLPRTKL